MWIFKKPEPPPPIYKRQPIATAAVILTIIGMFVLGPIGALWNGMAEELKKKADNETVIMLMKQQKENDDRQWQELRDLRNRSQSQTESQTIIKSEKKALTPEQFATYMNMKPEVKIKYKKYLENLGYDITGL